MSHLFLTGFMGAGKSTVGRLVADRLGRPFVDLDETIEAREGASVRDIFAERGEDGFRRAEHEALRALEGAGPAVVATGGGVILREDNRVLLHSLGTVVYLAVTPEQAIARLGDAADRPLLAGRGLAGARAILDARLGIYTSTADHVVDTAGRDARDVAEAVMAAMASGRSDSVVRVTGFDAYDIVVGHDILGELGARVRACAGSSRVALVSDATVWDLYGQRTAALLADAGMVVSTHLVAPGEVSKSWHEAGGLLESFAAAGLDRRSCVVALGGGVVGDLAGLCAATYMRGVSLVQVPTTLLAQVDSAIGGKTGVDLPAGKNLVGAFWPPKLVLADVALLDSLPPAEWTNGLVEMAKAALLAGDADLSMLEGRLRSLAVAEARDADVVASAVRDAAAFKARIVSSDLREAGLRECLNLGHTLGHALEMLAGYGEVSHGLAVAEGMRFASLLAERLVAAPRALSARTASMLEAAGAGRDAFMKRAQTLVDRFDVAAVLSAMKADKKARDGVVRFVLVERPGMWRVVPVGDYDVVRALEEWRAEIEREV